MKQNVRRLRRLLTLFNDDAFYSVECTSMSIRCQGWYVASTAMILKSLNFDASISDNGYIYFKRNNYTVVLTSQS